MNRGIAFVVVALVYLAVLITLAVIGNRKNKGMSTNSFLRVAILEL